MMKRILPYIIVLILSLIPFSFVVGETITHNFNGMYIASPKQLVITPKSSNKTATATTDDLTFTYTISGSENAKFGMDLHHSLGLQVVSVNLPSKNDSVIVYSPTDAIAQVYIMYYYPDKPTIDNIKVYASSDGSSYRDTSATLSSRGNITANIPRGSQYIKIVNEGNTAISIYYMNYTIENCNCFRYVPE